MRGTISSRHPDFYFLFFFFFFFFFFPSSWINLIIINLDLFEFIAYSGSDFGAPR